MGAMNDTELGSETTVYVDFDGVFNSFEPDMNRLARRTGWGGWCDIDSMYRSDDASHRLRVSRDRNAAMRSLPGASLVWLTSWWVSPVDLYRATGIGAPVITPHSDAQSAGWKAQAIEVAHQTNDRFVWIDDRDIPKGFGRRYPNALMVRPSPILGMSLSDVEAITAYLGRSGEASII